MEVTVNGMFWVQGERDSRDSDDGINPAINYEVNLTNLISSYRSDFANRDMPFIIGKFMPHWIGVLGSIRMWNWSGQQWRMLLLIFVGEP